jgi:NADH-quinone oxidoreductase subunit N
VASLFYYLRWLMPVFRTDPGQPSPAAPARSAATAAPARSAATAAVGAAVVVLGLGLVAGAVWPVLTGI